MSRVAAPMFLKAIALATMALASACAGVGAPAGPTFAQVAAQLPPIPPDRARIFFYRDYELYESMGRPDITLNGETAGISEPGGVFYRDVAPGRYLIAVRDSTLYPHQDKTVTLSAGQTAYAKIESLKSYNSGDSTHEPDTFVVVLVNPAEGQHEIASERYFPNGS
jgi:hypothetical protein